ncbi:MAG: hypothetical protein AAFY71_22395 [Bacteroidota bacterium]
MNHKFIWLILACLLTNISYAQESAFPSYQVSLSFFGENISHSGVRLGMMLPIQKVLKHKKADEQVDKAWVGGLFLTYYKDPRNHQGLMLTGSIGRQRIGKKGLQSSFNIETGYMLSLLDGEVYEQEGESFAQGNRASSHFVFGINPGIGWNFSKVTQLPLAIMAHPHIYVQAPYNTLFVHRAALEIKMILNLK